VALIETIAAGEYARVHCTPAGSLPAGEVNVRFSVALPPVFAIPDDSVKVLCAEMGLVNRNNNAAIAKPESSRFSARSTTPAIRKNTSRNLVKLGLHTRY
jgi:hypothetical protein